MLSDEELTSQILGVGDGPASFNSEMKTLGHTVVSVDPIYAFSKQQIEQRIQKTYDTVISQVKQIRMTSCGIFLQTRSTVVAAGLKRCESSCRIMRWGRCKGVIFLCRYRNSILPIISLIWQCARIYSFCIQISCHSVFTENLYKNFVACHERFGFSRCWRLIVGSRRMFQPFDRIFGT